VPALVTSRFSLIFNEGFGHFKIEDRGMHTPISLFVVAASVVVGVAEPACSDPAPANDSGTLVTTLGRDTVALESFTRSASRVEGHIVVRVPGTVLIHYVVDLEGNGAAKHSLVDIMPLGTTDVGARRVTIDFTNDSAFVDINSVGQHRRTRVPLSSPAMPQLMTGFGSSYGLYNSPVLYELYAPVNTLAVGDTVQLTTLDIASGRPSRRVFVRRSAMQVDADYFGMAWSHVTLDGAGNVAGVDATETTERTRTARANFMDVGAMATAYADADRSGRGLGIASPSEMERGKVGGASVEIGYSSPLRRGRSILGSVVPYGEVWRTGANEATTIVSDRSLSIGGTTIPAGTYTMWTMPKSDGTVDLIINSQHGQWGTDHDGARDIAHIPMAVTKVATPTDDFAIKLVGGDPGALRISWDTFAWSVPIAVAK
jgi:hypothetical protein